MNLVIGSKLQIHVIFKLMKLLKYILVVFLVLTNINLFSQAQYGIEKLSFNKNYTDDFSPSFYNDDLVFCSNRKNAIFITYTDTSDNLNRLIDIYTASPKKNNRWTDASSFSESFNSLFNEGPLCFFNQFKSVAFTRNLVTHKKFGNYLKEGNACGIFIGEVNNNKFNKINKFPYNSDQYNVMHPALTDDGQTMYFSSDMPGGIGGYDIYVSYFKQGNWTAPQNLGANINTDKNEAFPFIHPNGKLFFASKGWDSKGGYDIFFSQFVDNAWLVPQSMKEPFNTKNDDFSFIADSSMAMGYFTSNRQKSDDIFKFASFAGGFDNCQPQKDNNWCYTFFEDGSSEGDIQVGMKYEWDMGDGTKIRSIEAKHCFLKEGEYNIKLNVIDSLTGEVYFSQAEYKFKVGLIEQPFISFSEKTKPGEEITFDSEQTNLPFKVNNFFWDFGDGFRAVGATVSHTYLDEGTFEVKLSVEGSAKKDGVQKACVSKNIVVSKKRK